MRGATFNVPPTMKCDSCQDKATVFYTQVTGGELKKYSLCEACAESQGITSPEGLLMPAELFGGKPLPASPLDLLQAAKQASECPACGFTLENFQRVGRLGCPKCYQTFSHEIARRLPSLHKGVTHTGYFPEGLVRLHQLKTRLKDLHAQLDEAVGEERYEEAASLRDQINELEEQEKGLATS